MKLNGTQTAVDNKSFCQPYYMHSVKKNNAGTHVRSLNSGKTYMCLNESMAMTGQSAGVFWMWSRGWRNFSQSACRKLMEPAEDEGRLSTQRKYKAAELAGWKAGPRPRRPQNAHAPFSLMSCRATSCWNCSKLAVSSLTWNKMRNGIPSSVSSYKTRMNTHASTHTVLVGILQRVL